MNIASGRTARIDVLGSIQQFIWDIAKIGLQLIGLVVFVAVAPMLYLFFGFFCARGGDSTLPLLYIFTLPVAVGVWTFVICRLHAVRQWKRSGGHGSWREANGGWIKTMVQGWLTMVVGGFFSFVAEISAVALFRYTTGRAVFFSPMYMTDPTPRDLIVFWSLMPFIAFSPVIVLLFNQWIWRRNHRGYAADWMQR